MSDKWGDWRLNMSMEALSMGGYAVKEYPLGQVIAFPKSPMTPSPPSLMKGLAGKAAGAALFLIPGKIGLDRDESEWWHRFKNYRTISSWEIPLEIVWRYPLELLAFAFLPPSINQQLGIDTAPVDEAQRLGLSIYLQQEGIPPDLGYALSGLTVPPSLGNTQEAKGSDLNTEGRRLLAKLLAFNNSSIVGADVYGQYRRLGLDPSGEVLKKAAPSLLPQAVELASAGGSPPGESSSGTHEKRKWTAKEVEACCQSPRNYETDKRLKCRCEGSGYY